ncbi:transcriptional protein SWT1 [Cebidichthys violaceus]|uniref:transcriptional protein SWT1 n=1 Tax=Cebidichthys violaceus TaxID=271503 RepID=UPI0035C9AB97
MPKKSKKRKRKKSSSSSDEDEKSSKEQDVTKNYKSGKTKQGVNSQERCAEKQEKCALPSVKDVSQSTRLIKRPVYRRSKTQATDQKPVHKREECTKPKREISGNDNTVSKCKTAESGPSKPSNNAGTVPQRTEKMSKGSTDQKSSQSSTSKLKKQRMSPILVSADQREQRRDVLKKKCRAEEPPRTGNNSNTVETREPSKASVSTDSSWEKRTELFKKMCQRHQENKAKRNLCTEAKTPSVSTGKHSSTSSKQITAVSSSNVVKNVRTVPGNFTSMSFKTVKSSSVQQQICGPVSPLPLQFKISKKVQPRPVDSTGNNNGASSSNRNLKHGTEPSDSGASRSNAMQETVQQAHRSVDVTPSCSSEGQDNTFLSSQLPAHTVTEPWYDQMQVVEELHLARSEKRLEVNAMQCYGELTCMEIDLPEDTAGDTYSKLPQQNLILVLDTNVLLSHLDYVKTIRSHGLGVIGVPTVLIPWVVLQELDSLKRGRGMSGSVAHLATPAISYIYNVLKNRGHHLWGQSMQQAAEGSNGLNAENNDDRVLQCCLQYRSLYPECALILCTNDKNLCSKALLSGVNALSKNDLEAEIRKHRHGFHPLRNTKNPMLPPVSPHLPSPKQSGSCTHSQKTTGLSVEERDNKRLSTREGEDKTRWNPSSVCELEDCLREVLSDALEVEMKAAYEDLWLEIIYRKPPWTLQDVLQCLKKHWIAVFGHVVPRRKLQTVLNLIEFFNSGEAANCNTTSAALQEAKELVKVFGKSSRLVPSAISMLDNIYHKLQPQWEPPACEVVMNDNDEEKQPTSAQVSHQEVWALFENIWSHVFQTSLEVFKALGFDPYTMQRPLPVGGPAPPQDALVCLQKLYSMVSQLLQAFSRVLSSAPSLEEVQALLGIIHSNEIVDRDSRLTTKDLLDCFSQQDYREKLRVGGDQLMELKEALDCCIGSSGQHVAFTTSAP